MKGSKDELWIIRSDFTVRGDDTLSPVSFSRAFSIDESLAQNYHTESKILSVFPKFCLISFSRDFSINDNWTRIQCSKRKAKSILKIFSVDPKFCDFFHHLFRFSDRWMFHYSLQAKNEKLRNSKLALQKCHEKAAVYEEALYYLVNFIPNTWGMYR